MSSARLVEPRTSANRKVQSISAPPWWRTMKSKQLLHIVAFLSDGRLPIIRMNGAPRPENGAAHSLQRGSAGIRLKTWRTLRSIASPRVRKSRQNSSVSRSGGRSEAILLSVSGRARQNTIVRRVGASDDDPTDGPRRNRGRRPRGGDGVLRRARADGAGRGAGRGRFRRPRRGARGCPVGDRDAGDRGRPLADR